VGAASAARVERRAVAVAVGLIAAGWIVLSFGRALADANALSQRQASELAVNTALQARVDAGRREIAFIQTAAFLTFEARTYGMGMPRERAFALDAGAPSPDPIVPLGAEITPAPPSTPLDDWLRLLLGT
jgi:hypothetical protein